MAGYTLKEGTGLVDWLHMGHVYWDGYTLKEGEGLLDGWLHIEGRGRFTGWLALHRRKEQVY